MTKNASRYIFFYLLLFGTVTVIFFTHPFLRFPYDMWDHLIVIGDPNLSEIHDSRGIWHNIWRSVFSFFSIPPSEILLRARIIHTTQALISFFAIFLFGKVAARNIFSEASKLSVNYMAYWSTLIWFTIFATFSEHYHHIWIMWYSVNYQITLPLFWYITALTIIILFEEHSWKLKLFYLLQIIALSRFILQVHSMEYLYYLMYLSVLFIVYYRNILPLMKRYYYISIPAVLMILFFLHRYQADSSPLFSYLKAHDFSTLYQQIISQGHLLISGANRAQAAVNEMMKVSLFFGFLMMLMLIARRSRGEDPDVNIKMYLFIFITSLFVYIPLFTFSGGFASVLTKLEVVNRFYYSSSLFILVPIAAYYLTTVIEKKEHIWVQNMAVIGIVVLTLMYSRHFSNSHNYSKNIHSLMQSFNEREVGFNLSQDQIRIIGRNLEKYKNNNTGNRELLFYARPDITAVLKFIYRVDAFWIGRREYPALENFQKYCLTLDPEETRCIIFKTPKDFPHYIPYH